MSAVGVLIIQHRLADRREVRVRILNSYQDFVHFALQLLDFRDAQQREMWTASVSGLLKAVHDAGTFDSQAQERTNSMEQVARRLLDPSPISDDEAKVLREKIRSLFREYRANRRSRLARSREATHPSKATSDDA